MDQNMGKLIDECKRLRIEQSGLLAMEVALFSPSVIRELVKGKIAKIILENQVDLRKECHELGLEEVGKKRELAKKELDRNYSELAEYLEPEDFEVEKFKGHLSKDQFSWLISHNKDIKQHLKGIAI
jgi:hypothetical protein